jgi:hypothetical protein
LRPEPGPARPAKAHCKWSLPNRLKMILRSRSSNTSKSSLSSTRYRASGLNLVVAAIILWNTVYLERAVRLLQQKGRSISNELLAHLSPLGWEHINLTGDYIWHANRRVVKGNLRTLRGAVSS